jgi:hypothetical protein
MGFKLLSLGAASAISVALAGFFPPPDDRDGGPPPPAKKKGGAAGDLRKAYDGLLRLRGWSRSSGRPEERLNDWTERATRYYRDGVKAFEAGDEHRSHEFGAVAAELTRAVEHARNAALADAFDSDLPPPPPGGGPEADDAERARHDLRRVYDRLRDRRDGDAGRDARFFREAARDLYNAARRDAEAGRNQRAGELARAADAMSHALDHLGHLDGRGPEPLDDRPEPRKKKGDGPDHKKKGDGPDRKKGEGFEPRTKKGEGPDFKKQRDGDALPPPLD